MKRLRRLTRPLRHGFAVLAVRGLLAVLWLVPFRWACLGGAGLGRCIGWLSRGASRRMLSGLGRLDSPPPARRVLG